MMVPDPKAAATHGTTGPGATWAAVQSWMRGPARRAKSVRPCGQASAGLRPVAIQGRHASARPRDLPCPTIARFLDGPAASYPRIVHTAAGPDIAWCPHPQRSWSMKAAHGQRPAFFDVAQVTRRLPG